MTSSPRPVPVAEAPKESAVTRVSYDLFSHCLHTPPMYSIVNETNADINQLLIAPLTFLSFLLSLALISSRNDELRRKSHTPSRPSSPSTNPSFLARTKSTVNGWIWTERKGGPYDYVRSPDATPDGNEKEKMARNGGKEKEENKWHWHTKQREMMRMEVADAFELRKRVAISMALVLVGAVVAVAWWGWALGVRRW